jgi:homoserine kinase
MKEITVLAPATVANVVCGFDCLGFALENPCDEMTLRKSPKTSSPEAESVRARQARSARLSLPTNFWANDFRHLNSPNLR